MDRSPFLVAAAGLLAGSGALALLAGVTVNPLLLPVGAVLCAAGVAVWRRANRLVTEEVWGDVYADAPGSSNGHGEYRRSVAEEGERDDWSWAGTDEDDPFWGEDPEDPWDARTRDPDEVREERGAWHDRTTGGQAARERTRPGGHERARDGGAASERTAGSGVDWDWGRSDRAEHHPEPETGPVDPERAAAYETLGLEPGASQAEIRSAYRERIKRAHPDTPGGSTEEFKRVQDAYELLRE